MPSPDFHSCSVLGSPWPGVHGTNIDSAHHFGHHWHDTCGIGLVTHGAQCSSSGRGRVDARAGDVITTNSGEVHDGRPLAGASRRWRMVYFDAAVLQAMHAAAGAPAAADLEFTRPMITDPALAHALHRFFTRLARWAESRDALDALADAAAASGFADQSHMTRHFARQFGFPPGVWQAAFRARPQ